MDRDRAATKVVVALMAARRGTRVLKGTHRGFRVPVRTNPGKGNMWQCKRKVVARRATAMAMRCKHKVVVRRATAMMMVTRLWREPRTRRITREWRIGWGLAC